jgi:hypothetical protein
MPSGSTICGWTDYSGSRGAVMLAMPPLGAVDGLTHCGDEKTTCAALVARLAGDRRTACLTARTAIAMGIAS